jgi:hypothetical protein
MTTRQRVRIGKGRTISYPPMTSQRIMRFICAFPELTEWFEKHYKEQGLQFATPTTSKT